MDVFSVIAGHVDWVAKRHAVVATNIANIDTPNYKARAVSAFNAKAETWQAALAATDPAHFSESIGLADSVETRFQKNVDATHSGNDVVLEKELKALGENARAMVLDSSLAKIFHRMFQMGLKG